ncbi:cytochrome c biogenesis protein/redoxin [Erwinia sp.]|uniref:cytochrome c biogenesis protein/redoxin n=1 Tax=Erwinia citreus TaxID=558 RepID=UPI003C72573E
MSLFISFLAGMLTLLSPCTLPVIPFVFASVRGQKGQLAALLSGMVLMFTAVALLVSVSSHWVASITAAGRWIALVFLAVTALTLLSARIASYVSAPVLALGNHVNTSSNRRSGIVSAGLAGVATGLLWSPCAGPVLGAIISLSAVSKAHFSVGLLLIAYGSGCAVMLAILWGAGHELIARLRPGLSIMTRLRQITGAVMLASVLLVASGAQNILQSGPDFAQKLELRLSQHLSVAQPAVHLQPVVETKTTSMMPSLSGGTHWFNGDPLNNESVKGHVVLVDFWTYGCINCQHTLPHVRDWANKYKQEGLIVLGVHTPEYPWERDTDAVARAISKWQLPYTVVADNNYSIWNSFGNMYWPAHYIFDAKGQLRYQAFGEGDYARQEKVIQQLLKETRA